MIHDGALIEFFINEDQTTKPGETPEISIIFNGLIKHQSMTEIIRFIRKIQERDWNESVHVFASFQNLDQ